MKPVSIPLKLRDRPLFKGLPVPAVVMYVNGIPDFRITDLDAWKRIADNRLCSLCGHPLRKLMWFIGGPSAMEQRLFFDLPVHEECGLYSFKVCPYLALVTSTHSERQFRTDLEPGKEIINFNVRNDISPHRPELIGFAAATSYRVGHTEGGQPLAQAGSWLCGPYWFKGREDAEQYEAKRGQHK